MKSKFKRETSLPKITKIKKVRGRLKETEPSAHGRAKDVLDASQVRIHSDGQQRRDVESEFTNSRLTAKKIRTSEQVFVPVVDKNNNPLMPTTPSRARKWIKTKKATGFWKRGIYCVRLNQEPSDRKKQQIVVGIDPGSKKEGYTLKTKAHTLLNAQADTITWVKQNVETRSSLRRGRRGRNTPCRQPRYRRKRNKSLISPSIKSNWQWKLRVCNFLKKIFPITDFIVEDNKSKSLKGKRKWNTSFEPIKMGKNWFYNELSKLGTVHKIEGWETKLLRDECGLKKIRNKLAEKFEAHCVDSWAMATSIVGGHTSPDNTKMIFIKPLQFHRRQLHVMNTQKGGLRKRYGGTISMGFERGSLAVHGKHGLIYIGGTHIHKPIKKERNKVYKYEYERITIHSTKNGRRISRNIQPKDLKFLTYNSFIVH